MSLSGLMLSLCVMQALTLDIVLGDVLRFVPHEIQNHSQPRPPGFEVDFGQTQVEQAIKNTYTAKYEGQQLAFARYYGDHMVLQKVPKSAVVWGYADTSLIGHSLSATVKSLDGEVIQKVTSTVVRNSTQALWSVKLKPMLPGGPYSIQVICGAEKITIKDVLFGDVWLCSGQSNMQFQVSQMTPTDEHQEIEYDLMYSQVRLFTAQRTGSDIPLYDLPGIIQKWAPASVGGEVLTQFSAVCWGYGRRLFESLDYPVGLVSTEYGGTPIKAWSSPDALAKCDRQNINEPEDLGYECIEPYCEIPTNRSVLWNAMIHPFLNMTIRGVAWYQGEADMNSNRYNCCFPAMIADWRTKFHQGSLGQTDRQFPFGFVQLGPMRNDSSIVTGFPSIRWQQTVGRGFAPNDVMPNVFMAVAMDLEDFNSPWGGVHYRDKETVADRLYLSGMAVAYQAQAIKFQGPLPFMFIVNPPPQQNIVIAFNRSLGPIRVLAMQGYDICCGEGSAEMICTESSSAWVPTPIVKHGSFYVFLSASACKNTKVLGLRYAWRESPCAYKRCAIYSVENSLPGPPFVQYFSYDKDTVGVPLQPVKFALNPFIDL